MPKQRSNGLQIRFETACAVLVIVMPFLQPVCIGRRNGFLISSCKSLKVMSMARCSHGCIIDLYCCVLMVVKYGYVFGFVTHVCDVEASTSQPTRV